ncbi:hypothetical protein NLJ89_g8685 [Agrocybe chaxingu]|uniref:Uncharacterized protein n=1 Tax=Agrocybe chaxingu TaxID=84603 RepID=A0A9W8JX32_9AGAR|nr:hypothetical protein NLJ89_g8685 [Agrocybe chaxingu]
MDTLRHRIPFKHADDSDEADSQEVLDEQQQDALLEDLRKENDSVNRTYYTSLKILVGLSGILQLTSFNHNPLVTVFPLTSKETALPLPIVFIILSLFIHLNLVLCFCAEDARVFLQLAAPVNPLSYQSLYLLSAVAPTLSIYLGKPWQTSVWWCTTPAMVFIVQTVMDTIEQSNENIADLETMKYKAAGA